MHWARECPHSYENLKTKDNESKDSSVDVQDECVYLSLFSGLTKDEVALKKMSTLMGESKGCAILDTGCVATVCGSKWLAEYLNELTEYQQTLIKEEKSSSIFRLGDGVSVCSLKHVLILCNIGDMNCTILTDVVDCNIPLLLSKHSMKNGEMCLNFKNDSILIRGKCIKLRSTSSGHYALPLTR